MICKYKNRIAGDFYQISYNIKFKINYLAVKLLVKKDFHKIFLQDLKKK